MQSNRLYSGRDETLTKNSGGQMQMKIMETELKIPYQGEPLFGVLYKPEEYEGKLPVIIVSHGFYASYQMVGETAKRLAENGYATYCFDYRGCSYSRKSGGDLLHCSIRTEMDELSTVIDYFKQSDMADAEKIFLAGQSMGGVVSALTAAGRQEDITGIILLCPAMNMKETCRQYYPEGAKIPDVTENFIGIPGLNLGRMFFEDLFDTDFDDIFHYEKSVYLLHGTADEMVPVTYSETLKEKFNKVKFVTVPGAKHDFSLDEGLAADVSDFLNKNC